MIKFNKFKLYSCLLLASLFILTVIDVDARGRRGGGGGHSMHRSGGGHHRAANVNRRGPSRSGSLNANRSGSRNVSRDQNRQGTAKDRQGNRQDKLENRDKDREDWRDERWDHQDDVREERRDYAEGVRDERREWAEHAEWDDGIIEWDDGAEWDNIIAAGILVTGTAIAVSSFNNAPCDMRSVVVDGQTYYNCDQYWYQEAYQNGEVVYIVVNNPY